MSVGGREEEERVDKGWGREGKEESVWRARGGNATPPAPLPEPGSVM
jgi:hypothetical protein